MHQEDHADCGDDQAFLQQRALQVGDGAMDQVGAVVDGLDRHALGQAGRDLGDLGFQVVDHLQRVLPETRHRDARDDLAFAVQLGQAASLVGCHLDAGDVADQHRCAALSLHHQLLDVDLAAQVALAAHHELGLGHLDDAAADIAVGVADHLRDLHQRDAEAAQLQRIDRHLVGLHKAAQRRHLGHARRLSELVTNVPVLDRAQLGQALVLGQQRVLVDPADAGGIGAERRRHALGQAARREVQVLQHPTARPVDVGAVLENDVDEGRAEEGEAAHHFRLRHRQHRRGQRIGHLVLDDLRRLARVLGVDDDLHVRQVRQRIERRLHDSDDTAEHDEQGGEQDQERVLA